MLAGDSMLEVTYKCSKCGALDHGKFFQGERPYPAITCWSCKNGSGIGTLSDMIQHKAGMYPVPEVLH